MTCKLLVYIIALLLKSLIDRIYNIACVDRGHSRILIKGVRNTQGTGLLIVGNDGNG